ncbi:MAG: glycosyltransferase [Deltaproteobacteria bacterium]|nr:glycosyltransferase [Deltaproteobacteria bacterium]
MASGEPGGGATYLVGLLPELAKLEVQSCLITQPNSVLAELARTQEFKVYGLDLMTSRLDITIAKQLASTIAEIGPTLVHAHGTRAAFYCALASIHKYCPVVYTAHGISFRDTQPLPKNLLMKAVEWFSMRKLAALASVSEQDLEALSQLHSNSATPKAYIPNAVSGELFKPGNKAEARKRINLPEKAFIVGTVSRLVEQKAVHLLLDAATEVEGAHIVIVGDGPLEAQLRKLAHSTGIQCHFLGSRNDVPEILPSFDVFVLSSLWEGEPLSLLESMACGIPVIASDTPGACSILKNENSGLLFSRGSKQDLAALLLRLRDNPELRRVLSLGAIAAASERTLTRTAQQTVAVYQEGLVP